MNDHSAGCEARKLRLTPRGERVAAALAGLIWALATLAPTLERLGS